jgi:hypothetical protein
MSFSEDLVVRGVVMLFAGCSSCRSITALWCAGQFMPHMPTPVEPSPTGPFCRFCGQMPPVFTCMVCGTRQGLFVPGMAAPPSAGQAAPLVAPAVEAPPGASEGEVHGQLRSYVSEFVTSLGKGVGQELGQSMGAWMR